MHVYFVRHGETILNRRRIHQSPSTPLSENGYEQASTIAEHIRLMNPDLLLTSEYTRAVETARIISSHIGIAPTIDGLFYEVVRPSSLFHKSHYNIESFRYIFNTFTHRDNQNWRYKDAENFNDVKNRIKKATRYLESLSGKHNSVVVVSHTVFINILVAFLCRDRMLGLYDMLYMLRNMRRMKNTDLLHIEYLGSHAGNTCAWRLVAKEATHGHIT